MIYPLIFWEFFKIGLFSFGGGYATIPFLYHISKVYNWFSIEELSQITAIASVTPGPVGINAATYAGLNTGGLLAAFLATLAEVLPSFVLVIIVAKLLKKFSDNFYVKSVLATLKPISCALLVSVAFGMAITHLKDIKAMILLAILLILSIKTKKDPIFYILLSAFAGLTLSFV